MSLPKRVLVIGAGAAGLVTLKTLLEASQIDAKHPLDAILVEAESQIGGTFRLVVISCNLALLTDSHILMLDTGKRVPLHFCIDRNADIKHRTSPVSMRTQSS
jgi:cation diffusion facilitator CzcD-associated flavoprotein CzcO